jgi:predicted adenylyl cyclase CyaB
MPTNVEIKARVRGDVRDLRRRAAGLATEASVRLRQEDVFFRTSHGRLKLRVPDSGSAELIYYERADECGPRCSVYFAAPVADPAALRRVLEAAFGVRGVVRKERELFLARDTRIHLDHVESLGHFLELEVMLSGDASPEAGGDRCRELMEVLGVKEADLVERAYVDLLGENARGQPA